MTRSGSWDETTDWDKGESPRMTVAFDKFGPGSHHAEPSGPVCPICNGQHFREAHDQPGSHHGPIPPTLPVTHPEVYERVKPDTMLGAAPNALPPSAATRALDEPLPPYEDVLVATIDRVRALVDEHEGAREDYVAISELRTALDDVDQ